MSVRVCSDQKIVGRQVAAPILEAAHVERAALETERLPGVHLQRHGGEPVRFETLFDAARQIAERLDILEYREGHAILGQGGPQPPHVAEQVLAFQVQEAQRARRRGRARRGRGVSAELWLSELGQGEGRGRIRVSRAGEAGHGESGGASDRGPAGSDWTMTRAQSRAPTCRRSAMAGISTVRAAMSMRSRARWKLSKTMR